MSGQLAANGIRFADVFVCWLARLLRGILVDSLNVLSRREGCHSSFTYSTKLNTIKII